MTAIWILLGLFMGLCVALQGSFNSALAQRLGVGGALIVNTAIVAAGSIALYFVFSEKRFSIRLLAQTPWHEFLGGLCGFCIILLAVILFPRIGAGLTLTLAIAAQLTAALAIDHFGFMGTPVHPINAPRLAGLGLLALGAVLIKMY